MKLKLLIFLLFSTVLLGQRYEHKESWTAKDTNDVVYEVGVDILDAETGRSFRYGLPHSEWNKSDSLQVVWAINKMLDTYAIEDSIEAAKPKSPKKPTTTKVNKGKKYGNP